MNTTSTPQQPKRKRQFKGTVVSAAQQKTIVVRVDHMHSHPLYHKRYTVSKKHQVHDEKKLFHVGDVVEFIECRPISRHKKWRVLYPKQP